MAKKNVFDNEHVERLTVEWKKSRDINTYQSICNGCLNLIEAIVRSNGFYRQVPFSDIRNEMFVTLQGYLEKWDPTRGNKLYSYLSSCIFHSCISFVKSDSNIKKRCVSTDAPLDSLGNENDVSYTHIEYTSEDIKYLREKTEQMCCRWKEPIIKESLRFIVEAILQNRSHLRKEILKSLSFGYQLPINTSKFLLDWAIASTRMQLIEMHETPLGDIDAMRSSQKFSFIPDMINLIGFKNVTKLIGVFNGMTIKFPTLQGVRKCLAVKELINSKDYTPDNIAAIAKKLGVTQEKVQEAFETSSMNIANGLLEDSPLFGHDEDESDEDELEVSRVKEMELKDKRGWGDVDVPDFAKDFGIGEDEFDSLYKD